MVAWLYFSLCALLFVCILIEWAASNSAFIIDHFFLNILWNYCNHKLLRELSPLKKRKCSWLFLVLFFLTNRKHECSVCNDMKLIFFFFISQKLQCLPGKLSALRFWVVVVLCAGSFSCVGFPISTMMFLMQVSSSAQWSDVMWLIQQNADLEAVESASQRHVLSSPCSNLTQDQPLKRTKHSSAWDHALLCLKIKRNHTKSHKIWENIF